MLKKYIFLFLLFISLLGFSQTSTNTHIVDNSGTKVLDNLSYCPGELFDWKVDARASSTGSYDLVTGSSIAISAGTTPVPFPDRVGNNKFSSPLNIGFPFEFYGKTYTRVVVGSNGRLVFSNSPELDLLSTYTDLLHSGNGNPAASVNVKIPSPEYNRISNSDPAKKLEMAQIFAGYTDLHYTNTAAYTKVTFLRTTYSGKQALVFSFTDVVEVNNSTYSTVLTNQIVLFSDHTFLVRVTKKSNVQNALFGIQNESGTKAIWPVANEPTSVYNNGKWSVTSTPLDYLFKPNEALTPTITWTNNGATVSNTNTYSFNPTQDLENVQVKIKFLNDAGVQVGPEESSSVTLRKIKPVVVKDPLYTSGCGNPAKLEIDTPVSGLAYHWFNVLNPTTEIGSGTTINVGTGSYIAKAKSSAGVFCGESIAKEVNIASVLPVFAPPVDGYIFCDNLGVSSQVFNLNNVVKYPLDPTKYTITFLENGTPISSSVNINSGTSRSFKMRVETLTSVAPSCSFDADFIVKYQSFPTNGVITSTNKLCFDSNSYSISKFKTDFPQYASFDIRFSSDATNFDVNPKNPHNTIFVELKKSVYTCSSVLELKVLFEPEVLANFPSNPDPQCASSTQYFDLEALKPQINPDPNVEITFHQTNSDAETGANPQNLKYRSGIGTKTLYIRVRNRISNCLATNIPTVDLIVYSKPSIKTSNPISKTNCEGNSLFNLRYSVSELTDADSSIPVQLFYFAQSGTLLTDAEIDNYNASVHGLNPYIEIKYNSTCSSKVDFQLKYNPKPVPLKTSFSVCGESVYSSSRLISELTSNSSNYTTTLEDGSALPINFDVSSLPRTYRLLIKDNASGCVSDPVNITFVQGAATPMLTANPILYALCDALGSTTDGITLFDLNSTKAQFTSDPTATLQFYTDASRTNEVQATFTNTNPFSQTIYVKLTGTNLCPSFGVITLRVNSASKSTTLKDKYMICFGSQVSVDAGTENTKFDWSGGLAGSNPAVRIFDKPGNYTVVLTNATGCSYTHSFVISDEQQPRVTVNQDANKIEIFASGGVAPYRYSFDGGLSFQNSNILLNPTQKQYVIQVQSTIDANQGVYCAGELVYLYSIVVPNVLTPNGDGSNDTWTIANLDKMDQFEIVIADRFGKNVFTSADKNKLVWDGKHNGKPLATGTYWYVVRWYDPSSQKNEIRQGWILLKNRN